jgi:diguanylate cyclase (GGDEF)-like protein
VRQSPALQLTPIIFVTRRGDVEQRVHGLSVGGNDYVSKPFAPQELVARVRSHLQRLAELREMAIRDGLTRCYNNKYFKQRLEQEMSRAKRYQTPLTIGMLDIDHFKRVNDTFGHPAGDAVLAHLASLLTASVRATDVVARYGGEEFSFLLIEAAVPEALVITNRMRERIAKHRFVLQALVGGEVEVAATASIGLSQMQADDTLEGLVSRADAALYKAKQGGRNRVEPG